MTKKSYLYQCKLQRENWHTVAWIPEKDAKKGNIIKIKNEEWEVKEVYSKMESRKVYK